MFAGPNLPPVVVIPRVGKRMKLSKQAEKDHVLISERVFRNQFALPFVRKRLEQFWPSLQKKDLLIVAQQFPGLTLDRLAKRSRDCILCWFCEHWTAIEPLLSSACIQQPRVSECDSRNSCVCTRPETVDFSDDFGFGAFEFPFGSGGAFEFEDVLE
jgi:hypothetical protein